MVSPCPAPRPIRCSVKDLASCFYSCRFPSDQEEPHTFCSRQPVISEDRPNMAFDSKKDSRGQEGHGKESEHHISMNLSQSSSYSKGSSWAARGESQAEPRFAEEDYIVFCFRENGEIHMISDGQSSQVTYHVCHRHINAAAPLRPVSRKLHYSESIKLRMDPRREIMVNQDDNEVLVKDNGILISDINKEEAKDRINGRSIACQPVDKVKDSNLHCARKMDHHPVESCGSNLSSDSSSTGSFTFPELGVEWIGSPVHLPKAEDQEHDLATSCVELYCCRF